MIKHIMHHTIHIAAAQKKLLTDYEIQDFLLEDLRVDLSMIYLVQGEKNNFLGSKKCK